MDNILEVCGLNTFSCSLTERINKKYTTIIF